MDTQLGNDDLIADYLGEAHDYLEQLNAALLGLADAPLPWPDDAVNGLFRSAHSLKGLSACFGFEVTNGVTHEVESLLSAIRSQQLVAGPEVVRAIFDALDLVGHLTAEIASTGREAANGELIVSELQRVAKLDAKSQAQAVAERSQQQVKAMPGGPPAANAENETVRVRMERLDRMVNLTGELVVARSRFQLVTQRLRPLQRVGDLGVLLRELQAGIADLHDGIGGGGGGAESLLSLVESLGKQATRLHGGLDELQDLARVVRDVDDVAYDLDGVVGGIHEAVLQLRMVPLESVFRRLQRVVRDTAEGLGKVVDLEMSGGETQIDKRVADELVNPLVHMVRNSIDHGIEAESKRRDAGKRARGRLSLRAFQRGSSVVIELADDGGGIDPQRLLRKAVEIGARTPEEAAAMSPEEAQRLIFAPGFSTAKEVTEFSGRGMGMDIVMATIKGLRGSLELRSEVGKGTTFTIQLPPSMSILASLLLEVGGTMFALPLTEVREIVELAGGRMHSVQQRPVVMVRERPLPLVLLSETYRFPSRSEAAAEATAAHAVVFGHPGAEVALGVDRLVGKEDLVLKPVCRELADVPGLAGMAIRGDGKVTLILDPSGFADFALRQKRRVAAATA